MAQYLYTVKDVFALSTGWLVAVPGIPRDAPGIRQGTRMELRWPDGSVRATSLWSLFFLVPSDPDRPIQFSFPQDLTKADIPIGTEVWLDEDSDAA